MSEGPRTISLLYDLIENDYKWRISELSNFRNSLLMESNEKAQKANIRAGITLLYAHWEGFVKQVSNLYYEHVGFQSCKVKELNDSFVSILFRNELNTLQKSKKLRTHEKAIKTIFNERDKTAYFSSISPIRTSNLNFDVFEDVCVLLGIETEEFEMRQKVRFDRNIKLTIDEDLVRQRNVIAHGEYLSVNKEEFKTLYDIVINGFLYNFKEVVMDCAQNKKYLR